MSKKTTTYYVHTESGAFVGDYSTRLQAWNAAKRAAGKGAECTVMRGINGAPMGYYRGPNGLFVAMEAARGA